MIQNNWRRRIVVAAGTLALLWAGVGGVQAIRSASAARQEAAATDAILHGSETDFCVLALGSTWHDPYNQLGLVALNSHSVGVVNILQIDPAGGPSDHAIYTEYGSVGRRTEGDVMEYRGPAAQYGDFAGAVTPGGVPPSQDALERMCCDACANAIQRLEPNGDLLLLDYVGGRYYDLTGADYQFVIRDRYEVCTTLQADGTVSVHIWDRNTPQPAQK